MSIYTISASITNRLTKWSLKREKTRAVKHLWRYAKEIIREGNRDIKRAVQRQQYSIKLSVGGYHAGMVEDYYKGRGFSTSWPKELKEVLLISWEDNA